MKINKIDKWIKEKFIIGLDFKHNKYGIPTYYQTNIEFRYQFKGLLDGLSADLLIASKWNAGELYEQPKYEVNKVNMTNLNLIFNFNF